MFTETLRPERAGTQSPKLPPLPLIQCYRCGHDKVETEFYRRRFTGAGNFIGENARRGICKACEKEAYPQKRKEGPRKDYTILAQTRHGIRERLYSRGLTTASPSYEAEYQRAYKEIKE